MKTNKHLSMKKKMMQLKDIIHRFFFNNFLKVSESEVETKFTDLGFLILTHLLTISPLSVSLLSQSFLSEVFIFVFVPLPAEVVLTGL